jgi:hypothetical protein
MSDPQDVLRPVDRALEAADPEELPAWALALAARLGSVAARMAGPPTRRWVPASRAAEGAGVDEDVLRRWARRLGATWASWPTKRTLLVDVEGLDRWLSAGRFRRRVRNEDARRRTKPRVRAVEDDTTAHVNDRSAPGTAGRAS